MGVSSQHPGWVWDLGCSPLALEPSIPSLQLDVVFRANRGSWSTGKGWDCGLSVPRVALQSQVSPAPPVAHL